MNFLTNINLNGNELQNVVIQNLPQDPTPLKLGQFWYDSSKHQLKYATLVGEEIKAVVIGEGEVTDEELANLAEKITALESTVNGTEEIIGLIEEVATLKETVNGAEGQPSLSEQISEANGNASNALAKAEEAKTEAEKSATAASTSAQSATDSATAAGASATAAGLSAEAAQKSATDASSSASAASKSQEAAENAQSKADAAEKKAADAQAAAEAAQAAAEAVQTDVDSKVEKVVGPVNNIVVFDADGAIKDGGQTIRQAIDEAIAASAGEGEEIDLTGYVQKVSGAVEGNLVTLTSEGGIANSGYSINASINSESPSEGEIPTASAIAAYVNTKIEGVASGINYKGVLSSANIITTPYKQGDMYYVGERITIFDRQCDVGDILIAIGEKAQGEESSAEDWSFLEGNRDVFKGATTENIGAPGLVPPANPIKEGESLYLRSDGAWSIPIADRYIEYNGLLYPQSGQVVWDINHKLNKSAVQVIIYQVNDKINEQYTQVMCDIEIYGKNDCTIKFNSDAASIAADSYMAVIM